MSKNFLVDIEENFDEDLAWFLKRFDQNKMIHWARHAQFIIFYIICGISILINSLVLISLWKLKKSKSCFTFLLYFLHSTSVAMAILSFPFVYKFSVELCEAVQSFECYFSVMNILSLAFLVETHRSTIMESRFDIKKIVHQYGLYILCGLPLFVFCGFGTGTYESVHYAFCIIESDITRPNFLSLYFVWVWIVLLFCVFRTSHTLWVIFTHDKKLATRFFSSIGMYSLIAIMCWLPRTFIRFAEDASSQDDDQFDNTLYLIALIPFQLGTIVNCGLYFREKASIKLFESFRVSIMSAAAGDGYDFSWDEVITSDMLLRTTSTASDASKGNREQAWNLRPSFQMHRISNAIPITRFFSKDLAPSPKSPFAISPITSKDRGSTLSHPVLSNESQSAAIHDLRSGNSADSQPIIQQIISDSTVNPLQGGESTVEETVENVQTNHSEEP